MNSRAKGCRGERECRDWLRSHGFMNARRTQQYSGTEGTSDVTCPELPSIHIEAKRVERGNVYDWIEQARRDALFLKGLSHKTPIVWHKRNHREALVIMYADDWATLIKETDRVTTDCTDNADREEKVNAA